MDQRQKMKWLSISCSTMHVWRSLTAASKDPSNNAKPKPPTLAADLSSLEKTAELLKGVNQEMSARNLLSDILRLLIKYYQTTPQYTWVPAKMTEAIKVVKGIVEEQLGEHSPSKARYEKVLCLGYKVKTGGSYAGITLDPNDRADMRLKCDEIRDAVLSAAGIARTMGVEGDGKVLKIFMAPEFYFRGANGAYSHDTVNGTSKQKLDDGTKIAEQLGILAELNNRLNKTTYKDWLFVFGTAIAATQIKKHMCSVCVNKPAKFVSDLTRPGKTKPECPVNSAHVVVEKMYGAFVDNVALVMKEGVAHIVTKELVSGIDYESTGVKIEGNNYNSRVRGFDQPSGYKSADNVAPKFDDERMGGCIFTIDGVTIGLEVCLDHAAKSANEMGRLEHASNIQIQLIPSAGMNIGTLRTIAGGITFNVDGVTPHVHGVGNWGAGVGHFFVNKKNMALKPIGTMADELRWLENDYDTLKADINFWNDYTGSDCIGAAPRGSVVGIGPFLLPKTM